jgi:hypothetical protein
MSVSAKILTLYGCAIIALLLGIGILSDWNYFHSGNVALLALIIGSYPLLGIALDILDGFLEKNEKVIKNGKYRRREKISGSDKNNRR